MCLQAHTRAYCTHLRHTHMCRLFALCQVRRRGSLCCSLSLAHREQEHPVRATSSQPDQLVRLGPRTDFTAQVLHLLCLPDHGSPRASRPHVHAHRLIRFCFEQNEILNKLTNKTTDWTEGKHLTQQRRLTRHLTWQGGARDSHGGLATLQRPGRPQGTGPSTHAAGTSALDT